MPVPYTFGTATAAIPLSQLDSNFATAITLGNTAVYLGNTTTSIGNLTLTNVTINSGEVTTGNASVSGNVTLTGGTANGVAYLNTSKVLTTGSALVFDGTNLGVGNAPSAWFAGKTLQLGNDGAVSAYGQQTELSTNSYLSGGGTYKYMTNGLATRYSSTSGQHQWFNAASGTAGNAITFTQAMTLDASGNLGIGTTSPATKLDVNVGTTSRFRFTDSSGTLIDHINGAASAFAASSQRAASYGWGIGLTLPPTAMTLDASGNLLVGTTTAAAKFTLEYDGGVVVGQNINDSANTTNSTLVQFLIQGTQVGTIKRVGATSAVIYNTASDYRLKIVVGAVTGQGDRIDALKPINYLWKEGNTSARGFLAHEFQEVYANSVSGDKDAVDANGNPVYQAMQASTSEVIADLVAEIQSLRKRLAALESA